MSERDLFIQRRPRGARIYDAADDAAYERDEPRHDPDLANTLTIILVSVVVLGFVFGMVFLSSVF